MRSIKSLVPLSILFLWAVTVKGQEQTKKDLYFELNKNEIEYSKNVFERTVTIETTRKSINYGFLITCNCHIDGSLSFLGHNNPEVGKTSEPMKIISTTGYKKLKLITFNQLVTLLKKHDLEFNDLYNLYFVEACNNKKYNVYNIQFLNSFIDH